MHCEVNLEQPEAFRPRGAEGPPAPPAVPVVSASTESGRILRASEAFAREREACLKQACEQLWDKSASTLDQYQKLKHQWEISATPAPVESQLRQAMGDPEKHSHLKAAIKDWKAVCKDEAWLMWYAAKHEWLSSDLLVGRRHTLNLQAELRILKDMVQKGQSVAQEIATLRDHEKNRRLIDEILQDLKGLRRDTVRRRRDERQHNAQRASDIEEMIKVERQRVKEYEAALAQANRELSQATVQARSAHRKLLGEKIHIQKLQFSFLMRTCFVREETEAGTTLKFRGGHKLKVERPGLSPSASVRLALELNEKAPRSAGFSPAEVGPDAVRDFCMQAWRWSLEPCSTSGDKSPAEVSISWTEVPGVVHRLDALLRRTASFLRELKELPLQVPQVTRVSARPATGASAAATVAVTLIVPRSHKVTSAGIQPLRSRAGGAAELDVVSVELTFQASLEESSGCKWAGLDVQKVFGRTDGDQVVDLRSALRGTAGEGPATAAGVVARALQSGTWR